MAATAEVIVLSSSPVAPPKDALDDSLDLNKTPKRSPQDPAPPSLPTAAELFRPPSKSRFFADQTTTERSTKKKTGGKKPASKTKPNEKDASTKPPKVKKTAKAAKPDALDTLKQDTLDSRDNSAKRKTTQKSRSSKAPKSKEAGNMTLAGKVTKAGSECRANNSKKAAGSDALHGDAHNLPTNTETSPAEDEKLHLDEAMRRRRDWTPPKETAPQDVNIQDDIEGGSEAPASEEGLGKLLADYSYSGLRSNSREAPRPLEGGPTKRRKIELVDPATQPKPIDNSIPNGASTVTAEDSSSSSAPTKKKPKGQKKPTTVTARMTAQYTSKDDIDNALIKELMPEITKAKSGRSKAKTLGNISIFNVASPEVAAKTLDAQDLIFGTCSQLEREDSPETLREIQKAIDASESSTFAKEGGSIQCITNQSKKSEGLTTLFESRFASTKNLWGVGARDTDGSLVQNEKPHTTHQTGCAKISGKASVADRGRDVFQDDDWLEEPDCKASGSATSDQKPILEPKVDPPTCVQSLPGPVPTSSAKGKEDLITSQPSASQRPSMPQYTGFTDTELSKQVAAYGFKSVRGRKKMVELLQKCWESRHGKADSCMGTQSIPESAVSGDIATEPSVSSTKQTTKAKSKTTKSTSSPKGSPRKPTQKVESKSKLPPPSFIDVEEIQDSEEEVIPSPSRVQKHYTDIRSTVSHSAREASLEVMTKAPPKSLTNRKTTASKASRTTKAQSSSSQRSTLPDLGAQMTKAIRAQPGISSQASLKNRRVNPTWHEKIVMYDSIILEDLATWLNVEGFAIIGEDCEVGPLDVRKWCESKGICCCWKQGSW